MPHVIYIRLYIFLYLVAFIAMQGQISAKVIICHNYHWIMDVAACGLLHVNSV
jgi:hypothetical protein